MKKTAIFFYTNNFINRNILKETLEDAVCHCEQNDCDLIITSHYPITSEHIDVSSNDLFEDKRDKDETPEALHDLYVTDLDIDMKGVGFNYVVGRLPYNVASILRQLLLSFSVCDKEIENVIFFEHDCFYPDNYIEVVEEALENHNVTHAMANCLMVNRKGFYRCEPHMYMSSFAGRKDDLYDIYLKKKELYLEKGDTTFRIEPFIEFEFIKKSLTWKSKPNLIHNVPVKHLMRPKLKHEEHTESSSQDALTKPFHYCSKTDEDKVDAFCIDDMLGLYKPILELQHGVNTSNCLQVMREVYDNAEVDDHDQCYARLIDNHMYWGSAKRFTDMINSRKKDEYEEQIERFGLTRIGL